MFIAMNRSQIIPGEEDARAFYRDGNAAALVENYSTRHIWRYAGGGGSSTAAFASSLIGQQSYLKASFNGSDVPEAGVLALRSLGIPRMR